MANEISIREMQPTDAAGLTRCIRRCYGDSYPKRAMYDAASLAEQVHAGSYNGVVATDGADIVGHIGYSRANAAATVVEAGTTVVDADYRGAGLMGRLATVLRHCIIADQAVGFVHFPTTAHPVMQKASLQSGGCETGVMLAYLPAKARDLLIGGNGDDRLAVTVVYQPLTEAPAQAIFLPDRYSDLVTSFASHLKLRRTSVRGSAKPSGKTKIRIATDAYRKLERLTAAHIGKDFADVVVSASGNSAATTIHVDLMMNQPELHKAVEDLRKAGFAFAAWLPGWNESDVLRLQLLKNLTIGELHPALHSPEANDIAALIRSELDASAR